MKKICLYTAAAVMFTLPAKAVEWEFKPYIGLDYVYSDVDIKRVAGIGEYNDYFNSGAVNAGIKFNKYFGLEGFYQKSDKQNKSNFEGKTQAKFDAGGLDLVGYLPLGCEEKFSFMGMVGAGYYDFDGKFRTYDPAAYMSENSKGWGYRFGGGAEYDLTDHFALRAGVRYVWTDDVDGVDNMWEYFGGVKVRF